MGEVYILLSYGYISYDYAFIISDIDECDLKLFNCTNNAECMNLDGGYRCVCETGFAGNELSCIGKEF